MLFDVNTQSLFMYQLLQKINWTIVSTTFLLVCFLSLNESASQTTKIAFYFTSESLSVVEKITF